MSLNMLLDVMDVVREVLKAKELGRQHRSGSLAILRPLMSSHELE